MKKTLNAADPDLLFVDGTCWLFPTRADAGDGDKLFAYSSDDLTTWVKHGPILRLRDIAWADDGAPMHELWAPGVFFDGTKYILYYSVGPQGPTASRIGIATSQTPRGPFVDSGKPLITGGNGFEAIDAMVFKDPQTDKIFLYCGGSAGAKLRVFELKPNAIEIEREVLVDTPPEFTEASFMHCRDGLYYLSYSHGRWNDDSYSVCYSTSTSPVGPWTYRGKILRSQGQITGPGHHAFFKKPGSDDWYIVYHRWLKSKNGKMPRCRTLAMQKISFDANGAIEPIDVHQSISLVEAP